MPTGRCNREAHQAAGLGAPELRAPRPLRGRRSRASVDPQAPRPVPRITPLGLECGLMNSTGEEATAREPRRQPRRPPLAAPPLRGSGVHARMHGM